MSAVAPPSSFGLASRVIPRSKLVGFTRLLCFGSRDSGCSGVLGSLESGFARGLAVRLRISGVSGAFSDVLVVLPLRVSFRSRAAVLIQKGCEPRWTVWDLSHPLASARALRFPRNICAVVPAFFRPGRRVSDMEGSAESDGRRTGSPPSLSGVYGERAAGNAASGVFRAVGGGCRQQHDCAARAYTVGGLLR